MALRLRLRFTLPVHLDSAGVFGHCARAGCAVPCSARLSRRRLPPPTRQPPGSLAWAAPPPRQSASPRVGGERGAKPLAGGIGRLVPGLEPEHGDPQGHRAQAAQEPAPGGGDAVRAAVWSAAAGGAESRLPPPGGRSRTVPARRRARSARARTRGRPGRSLLLFSRLLEPGPSCHITRRVMSSQRSRGGGGRGPGRRSALLGQRPPHGA